VLVAVAALPGCGDDKTVIVELDFPNPAVFLHTDTIALTLHEPIEGELAADTCARLEVEAISPDGFQVAPTRQVPPTPACEFLRGEAPLGNLPTRAIHYVATASDATGSFVGYGCTAAELSELQLTDEGDRRMVVILELTSYYNTTLSMTPPPFPSVEARCGEAPTM
jgi:hypothetical protein